jgi:hypothetical protein
MSAGGACGGCEDWKCACKTGDSYSIKNFELEEMRVEPNWILLAGR